MNKETTVALTGSALELQDGIPWFDGAVDELEPPPQPNAPPPPVPDQDRVAARGDRVRDEGEIARGGMGSIRRLYDLELRRRVAVKLMDPRLGSDPDLAQRFIDEARITGRLDHANIIPVHDLLIDDRGVASYTMKLVDGQMLTDLIAMQRTQRDVERILQVLIQVCDAVSFAHSRGIIHRDLKPDNVMVGSHGQVYVMDWGCALVIGDRSFLEGKPDPDGLVLGTVNYMAPEQARGEVSKIDARTDVFALGAILYKALTGSAPYQGPTALALQLAQLRTLSTPDDQPRRAMKPPPILTQIAMKAMELEPDARFQSADELADALRAFLRGGNWFPVEKLPAGTVIVREGDRADAAYIITAGTCAVTKQDPQHPGRSFVVRSLKAGDVFGETAIFADAPRSATVTAVDEVSAVVVDRAALESLVASSYLGLFVKALADRFLDVDARLSQLSDGVAIGSIDPRHE